YEIKPRRIAGHELRCFAERLYDDRSNQRAEQSTDPADDWRQQCFDGYPRSVADAGINEKKVLHVEAARGGGDSGGDSHGLQLDLERVDAERYGGILVFPHRHQPGAEARAFDEMRH